MIALASNLQVRGNSIGHHLSQLARGAIADAVEPEPCRVSEHGPVQNVLIGLLALLNQSGVCRIGGRGTAWVNLYGVEVFHRPNHSMKGGAA